MRYQHPIEGKTRARVGFLLMPRTIEGETRWLEQAMWIERYGLRGGWRATRWVERT